MGLKFRALSPSPTASPSPTIGRLRAISPKPGQTSLSGHPVHISAGTDWSVSVPAWITALATIGLLVGAIVTAVYAKKAFEKQAAQLRDQQEINNKLRRVADLQLEDLKASLEERKQSRDVADLQFADLQGSLDERQRDRVDRRRAQAASVFIAVGNMHKAGTELGANSLATNESTRPIYDLIAQWNNRFQKLGAPEKRPQLGPGETTPFNSTWHSESPPSGIGISVEFRDAAGVCWRTTDRGELIEICGAAEPWPSDIRCFYKADHEGRHSWEA
jgi:hypothetical protein